jgi:cellobiose phosphorylase
MVSAWTAGLMYQTVRRYGEALAHFGETTGAAACARMAHEIETDFQRHLMPDGVVAGFAVFDGAAKPRAVEYLLHPSDTRTGLRYRLIPMSRGILSGIFTPQQASRHLDLIREHLLYPDGARLMDRPTQYTGGIERTFRRAESAAFFGREIGLQYVHAHLRYAEALAMMGRADELWRALLVASPIAVTDVVKNARPRQRNCYFSSSDGAFFDRYEASRDYGKLRTGEVPVDGGWRIYSSGPGIYTSLVIRHLFGLRGQFDQVMFDPVLPNELRQQSLQSRRIDYRFNLDPGGRVSRISLNGKEIPLQQCDHPYRAGAVQIARSTFDSALRTEQNLVEIS